MIRFTMTEEEHIAVVEAGNQFSQGIAKLVAPILNQFPDDVHQMITIYLQDQTSLFAPYTADLIDAELVKLRQK